MLAGKRAERVGDEILREMALLLLEKVKDPRVQGVTLTGIRLSKDLRQGKVYFSVIGGEPDIERAGSGLASAKGFIKREIGMRMSLKHVPDIVFVHDPSLESGSRLEKLFERLKSDEPENGSE